MTFHRKPNAKGGNGRVRMGKFWVMLPQEAQPVLRTVFNDNQGYFINLDYKRAVVAVDADGVWHVVEKEQV